MSRRPDQLAAALNAQWDAFKAFLVARVGSAAEAEDILQDGLLKALRGPERRVRAGRRQGPQDNAQQRQRHAAPRPGGSARETQGLLWRLRRRGVP